MTTQTIRTRDGSVTILTAPPRLSYPMPRSRSTAGSMLPLPSIGNQREGDGWPDWTSTSAPTHLIRTYIPEIIFPVLGLDLNHETCFRSKRTLLPPSPGLQLLFLPRLSNADSGICVERNYNADLQLPPGWPPGIEWRPPYGSVIRSQLPTRSPRFDPRSMLWWSQWEIVFAKKVLGLSDADTCLLFRFRWQVMDKSTRYMQPCHVDEIMRILSDGHPWHAHAMRAGDPRSQIEICAEFLQDMRMARECEQTMLL